jgi:hypothetical protein
MWLFDHDGRSREQTAAAHARNVPCGGDHPGAESAAEQPRKRGIPLLKCKFVAESLAKVRLIGDSLSTVARLSIEFEH